MGCKYAPTVLFLALVPFAQAGGVTERSTSVDTTIASAGPPNAGTLDDPSRSQAFDLTAIRIADYRWGKRAAASYTFDDGPPSSFQIAETFESVDLRATFFIIPGLVGEAEWPRWKAVAERGHEIANHSQSHLDLSSPDLSDEQLTHEIVDAQRVIAGRLGQAPRTFAFPYNWASPRSAAIALRTHQATRNLGLPFGDAGIRRVSLNIETTTDQLDEALLQTLAERGWLVANGHGIDEDGWDPIPSEVLAEHLALAANLSAELWIDTFANVASYRLARRLAQPTVIAASRRTLRVRLEGAVEAPLDSIKLTIEIPVIEWPAAVRAQDASGVEIPLHVTPSALFVEARPLEEIQITIDPRRR